jgi:hypothetical protein
MPANVGRFISNLFLLLSTGFLASAYGDPDLQFEPPSPSPSLQLDAWTRSLMPFVHVQTNNFASQWSVPPLFSRTKSLSLESEEIDFLYPLLTYDRYGEERKFQILQILNISGGQDQTNQLRKRFAIVPFYYQQRSPITEQNYTALMPFYGTIKGRYLRDEIKVALFPLYSRTKKRDVVTENYLYPFIHRRKGDKLSGWQVLPIIGYEKKGITTKTDGFGDTRVIGGHEKLTLAWPFYHNNRTGIGTVNPRHYQAFVPFFVRDRSPERDYTSYAWPFFNYVDDRKKNYQEWSAPWPFITYARGEGKQAFRIFPLFARAKSPTMQSDSYLWPLYKYQRKKGQLLDRERTRLFYFLYSDVKERNLASGDDRRRVDLWPFFTYSKGLEGRRSFQILAPVEPILPGNKSIARNLSPLWSLYRRDWFPENNTLRESYLLNLYRREKRPGSTNQWFAFGLFGRESSKSKSKWTFCNIPLN